MSCTSVTSTGGSNPCVATSGQNKITISSDSQGVKFVSCADSCGAQFSIKSPSGATLSGYNKLIVPPGGCRTDVVPTDKLIPDIEYTARLTSPDFITPLFEATFKIAPPSGGNGKVQKELVTNLTDNESLIIAAVFATSNVNLHPVFIRKYQEGDNWVFLFEFDVPLFDYAEFGAGAGLARFIEMNWKSISYLLAILGIGAIVWVWREPETKHEEVRGKVSDNTQTEIDAILNNPELTPEQKTTLIEEILKGAGETTDWAGALIGLGALLGLAYVAGEALKGYKVAKGANRRR